MNTNTTNRKPISKGLWLAVAAILVIAVAALLIVPKLTGTSLTGNEITFSLSIEAQGTVIFDDEVSCAQGTTLIDAMREVITDDGAVVCESSEYGEFITAICGYEQNPDEGLYWTYTVNEGFSDGVSAYCPQEGDVVKFTLDVIVW